jgi:hypothetical protein
MFRTLVVVAPDGKVKVAARTPIGQQVPFCVGRAPEGYVARACGETEATYFAALARDEAASIASFERLARELRAHGAPEDLTRRAERAADDERRHARMMAALAGLTEVDAFEPPAHVRSLEEIAIENAVEGCVRETYAALVAHHQAAHAESQRVRSVMTQIAEDETEHAELARDVDAWARERLSEPAALALEVARTAAIAGLESGAFPALPAVGLPSKERAEALISTLRRFVWA